MVITTTAQCDSDLVLAMAGGDSQALAELYRRYQRIVSGIAFHVLGSRAEAEELSQEVFVEVWKRAGQFDPARGTVKSWVCRIARSRAIDATRARRSRGAGRTRDIEDCTLKAPESSSPWRYTLANQNAAMVHGALDCLTDVQRSAVEMSFLSGLTHHQIAGRLGIPVGTVKSRMDAAMRRLRAVLAPSAQLQAA